MSSVFRLRKSDENGGGSSDDPPPFKFDISDVQPVVEDEQAIFDLNEKLMVIPISQEIARDFSLIGYDSTIRHIEEVMTQNNKRRNPLIWGDNGIGKTAITQGLVQRKNRRGLSTNMYKRTFYRLNTSRLLHADDVREINKRFDQILIEFGQYDVLVIENFYTFQSYLKIKGANSVLVGYLEALSRRKFQSIITCNAREKALLLAEVPEIHEFFSSEKIPEPTDDELLNILRGVHRSYEKRYGVSIPDDALCMIKDLTQKYRSGLEEWAQPGRAFTILDRAIAQFSVRMNGKPDALAKLELEYDNISNEVESLCRNDDSGKVAKPDDQQRVSELLARIKDIEPNIKLMREEWDKATEPVRNLQLQRVEFDKKLHIMTNQRMALFNIRGNTNLLASQNKSISQVDEDIDSLNERIKLNLKEIAKINDQLAKFNLSDQRNHEVTVIDISKTFSELTGIPVNQLNQDERARVLKIEETLAEGVYGQPEAISLVSNAVRRAKAKLSDQEGTPKGSFLFLGPSGVGKTELGKGLARFETGSEKNLIRIDMSEFMEKASVSRLIGAPPGYVGYDEGGVLTNAVHDHPKSVVMLDEIEKAHQDVFKILLQVLGDGRLTDGKGLLVDFSETYIVLTSNIGTAYFLDSQLTYDQSAKFALEEVKKFLAPELRGRLDSIICFRRLGLENLERVAKKRYSAINHGLARSKTKLVISDTCTTNFCKIAQNPDYGARAILTALKTDLEKSLAFSILEKSDQTPGTYTTSFDTAAGCFAPVRFIAEEKIT